MACPVCEYDQSQLKYQVKGHSILECERCAAFYLNDLIEDKGQYEGSYLVRDGSDSSTLAGYYDYESELKLHLRTFDQHLDIVEQYASNKQLLDMGCATGHFMLAASKRGFECSGVDISADSVAQLKAKWGFQAWSGDVRTLNFPQLYDVITTWETIEHLQEPISILDKLYSMLKAGGLLIVGTGNNQSLVARTLGRRWWYISPPDHCVYYNPGALDTVLRRSRFQPIGHHRVNLHWVSSRNVAQKLMRTFDLPSKTSLKVIQRLPDVGLPIVHGTTMVHVARKPKE